MRRNRILSFGGAVAITAALTACDNDPSASGTARVSVHLTDAPGALASAEVEIREIYLQGSGGDSNGRVVLFSGNREFDLLELQNGVTAELAEATIPAGSYSQLRMVIGDATITTESGATYSTENNTLHCPSCSQSGLKVNLPGGAVDFETGDQTLIVDFDVAQSFGHQAGNSGRWIMHPVIAATNAEVSAAIIGTVSTAVDLQLPACGGGDVDLSSFVPTFTAGDLSFSGRTDAEGEFRSAYVAPGTYSVGFDSTVSFDNGQVLVYTASSDVEEVTVSAGQTATVDYTVLTVSCDLLD